MAKKVVKLASDRTFDLIREHLNEDEFADFAKLCDHHSTIGHVVFTPESDVVVAENVDETDTAAFANVFDICGALTEEVGQKTHVGTSFESRKMEIICRCYSNARTVVLQSKNTVQTGA